jgi:hypothetical protein
MLLLKQSESQKIAIALNQLVTIETPNYLFSFFHQQKREYFNFFLEPITTSNRYNLFLLSLPTDIDLPKGNYMFNVYESVDQLPITDGKNILIKGKAEVITDFPNGTYYTVNTINNILYA